MKELPLRKILARVSRSFYLSLWLLPERTRDTVALAYLLARAADTVADTRMVSPEDRIQILDEVADLIAGVDEPSRRIATLAVLDSLTRTADVIPEEKALLDHLSDCVQLLQGLPELERSLVRRVLSVITAGQRSDLLQFPGERKEDLAWLESRDELFHYCYQVAGCVGEFWSDLHAARLPSLRKVDREAWRARGRRFGRALQLTNVLRDMPRDLRHGRCYLPREDLAAAGLAPGDLLDPGAWSRLEPLYRDLVAQAVSDARAGLEHTLTIRPREVALRMAGLLPLLLALQTLGVTCRGNPLDPDSRRKVRRRTVYLNLVRCFLAVRDDRAVGRLFRSVLKDSGLSR